ncbi:hypothetical protein LZY01_00270 [Levilactobacillus zymae]|uniref:Preprotein translocase subunit SecB n=1 Tax=Levilactobacillus zymae TaxID=267363 RepID=A0ABQ0WSN4_9LACO|nr:protein-export chaperone SecB [Levilactobacillus zymae]KRL15682.1 hypothetical protein FD38_GL000687 [Levilactobacillus zymae DSM 19395]QFR60656.1 preprotein translocase subunit SecB [Levilactobacillus zymae]GEO70859.1 hypothetical protein LZY01_00270 [Levilactobacillus zymae]
MPALEFTGYTVEEQRYQRNKKFKTTGRPLDLKPRLTVTTALDGDTINVLLGVHVGTLAHDPFAVVVQLQGEFLYHASQDRAGLGVDTLIRNNAVAILYPYVRALVSNLTNASNDYPALILPTIDVTQVLKEQTQSAKTAD